MKPKKKTTEGRSDSRSVRKQEAAYGDEASICLNAGCILRKKAKCFGFEGCPGFKGR